MSDPVPPIVSTPPPEPPPPPELTLEEREKQAEEQAAKQRQGKSGFEAEAPAEDAPFDPRAAKRAELQRQLAALDEPELEVSSASDKELTVLFFDGVHKLLGSHPSLDRIWTELKARLSA